MSGRISFIGAGPGAADLITIRAARRIAEADVVVWSASTLDPECVRDHAREDVELVDSSQLAHEPAVELFRRAERDRLRVVRLHAGDPALWGAVQDQYDACARMDLEVEIVPGVSGVTAAAAAVGRELTRPEVAQSVVLTRLGADSRQGAQVREFARDGVTLAVQLPAARAPQLVEELRAGGHDDEVPVLVAHKVSRPDELLLRTTVGELEQSLKARKFWGTAVFLVGKALAAGSRSRGYHGDSGYRRGESSSRRRSYRTSSARRRAEARADDPGELPQQRGVAEPASAAVPATGADTTDVPAAGQAKESSAVPNIAWWAVREWQEEARSASRVAARPGRRADDPAQSELFGPEAGGPEAQQAGAAAPEEPAAAPAKPELSVVRTEESPAAAGNSVASGTAGAAGSAGAVRTAGATGAAASRTAAEEAPATSEPAAGAPNRAASGTGTGKSETTETGVGKNGTGTNGTGKNETTETEVPEERQQESGQKTARATTSAASTGTSGTTAKTTRSRGKAQTKSQKTAKSTTRSRTSGTKRKDTSD